MINDVYVRRQYVSWPNRPLLGMLPDSAKRVLDIGCGTGANLIEMQAQGRSVRGVTLSESEANVVRGLGIECSVADCSVPLPFASGEFDAIVASHVLEHLPWPETAVRNLLPLLSAGGALYAAVPNVMFFRTRMQLILGNFPRCDIGVFDETHLRWFTWETPPDLARRAGCEIAAQGGDAWFRHIPWLPKFVGEIAVKVRPNLFSQQIRFVLKPLAQ